MGWSGLLLGWRAVAIARHSGWNEATIGRLLGMTRQGTRKRFDAANIARRPDPFVGHHRADGEPPPTVRQPLITTIRTSVISLTL